MVWFVIVIFFSTLLELIDHGRLVTLETISRERKVRPSTLTMG